MGGRAPRRGGWSAAARYELAVAAAALVLALVALGTHHDGEALYGALVATFAGGIAAAARVRAGSS